MQALFQEAEELLEKWKHPDPYIPPTAPGGSDLIPPRCTTLLTCLTGSKYERNIPAPILDRMCCNRYPLCIVPG